MEITLEQFSTIEHCFPRQRGNVSLSNLNVLTARLNAAADQALARLVRESSRPDHLICDLPHRLLACSPSRAAQFASPVSDLLGRSLWRFATPEIISTEFVRDELGWREAVAPPALEFSTGNNDSPFVPTSQTRYSRCFAASSMRTPEKTST